MPKKVYYKFNLKYLQSEIEYYHCAQVLSGLHGVLHVYIHIGMHSGALCRHTANSASYLKYEQRKERYKLTYIVQMYSLLKYIAPSVHSYLFFSYIGEF